MRVTAEKLEKKKKKILGYRKAQKVFFSLARVWSTYNQKFEDVRLLHVDLSNIRSTPHENKFFGCNKLSSPYMCPQWLLKLPHFLHGWKFKSGVLDFYPPAASLKKIKNCLSEIKPRICCTVFTALPLFFHGVFRIHPPQKIAPHPLK